MALIVADSDVLIDALRGREEALARVERDLETGALATTAVTAFELRSGARDDKTRDQVETLLAALPILPFDDDAADHAASARRALEANGAPIGMADYMIAGICLSRSAEMLTRNRGHFERIEALRVTGP